MKIMTRILIILAAALVVVGATVVFTNSNLGAKVLPGLGDGNRPGMDDFSPGDANFPRDGDGRPAHSLSEDGFRGDGRHDSRFSLFGTLKNLAVIAAIVLAVVIVERLITLLKRRTKQPPAAPQGAE
ncbi:MAG: hypothetical protein KBE23_07765 [Chloroflexi bacterium]|nr:hypothetical protein [Chloroflexota bacterium]MBP7042626.1 hypothetical protein [Chloroflexota bacterium]